MDARSYAIKARSYAMDSVNGRSCTMEGAVGGPVAVGGSVVAVGVVGGDGGCETRRKTE